MSSISVNGLRKTKNLSDVASLVAARSNLGLTPAYSRLITPRSGVWAFFNSSTNSASAQVTATFRCSPYVVPTAFTITDIGLEVITPGDAGGVMRIGIYSDNGQGLPSALYADIGTVPSDVSGIQTLSCSVSFTAGQVLWVGAVSQNITTTNPFIRHTGTYEPAIAIGPNTSSPPAAGTSYGGYQSSVAAPGALPATITAAAMGTGSPRLFFKTA